VGLVSTDSLLERYAEADDQFLVELALAPGDLSPDGRSALTYELERRDLLPELLPAIQIESGVLTDEELASLVEEVQRGPCPHCGESPTWLNGFMVERKQIDLWFVYEVTFTFVVGCQPCLRELGHPMFKRIERDQAWPATEGLVALVRRNAGFLMHYRGNLEIREAILKSDCALLLDLVVHGSPMLAEAPSDEADGRCPGCGAEVAEEVDECPDCGLAL